MKVNPAVLAKVAATFEAAESKALSAPSNNFTKFGEAEQLSMIKDLVELLVNDSEVATEGYDAISDAIGAIANASARAQTLEKRGKITRSKKDSREGKKRY